MQVRWFPFRQRDYRGIGAGESRSVLMLVMEKQRKASSCRRLQNQRTSQNQDILSRVNLSPFPFYVFYMPLVPSWLFPWLPNLGAVAEGQSGLVASSRVGGSLVLSDQSTKICPCCASQAQHQPRGQAPFIGSCSCPPTDLYSRGKGKPQQRQQGESDVRIWSSLDVHYHKCIGFISSYLWIWAVEVETASPLLCSCKPRFLLSLNCEG